MKHYISPKIQVKVMLYDCRLLAGSAPGIKDGVGDDGQFSKKNMWTDMSEDEEPDYNW